MAPGQIEKKEALGHELAQVHFGRLYREHGRAILAYALRRVGDPEDAADVVAETFLIAWRRLGDVPAGDRARLWLYAVARRVVANQHQPSSAGPGWVNASLSPCGPSSRLIPRRVAKRPRSCGRWAS
jgi:DNA-directed RNA polymerase specialized sigma24 family protein